MSFVFQKFLREAIPLIIGATKDQEVFQMLKTYLLMVSSEKRSTSKNFHFQYWNVKRQKKMINIIKSNKNGSLTRTGMMKEVFLRP